MMAYMLTTYILTTYAMTAYIVYIKKAYMATTYMTQLTSWHIILRKFTTLQLDMWHLTLRHLRWQQLILRQLTLWQLVWQCHYTILATLQRHSYKYIYVCRGRYIYRCIVPQHGGIADCHIEGPSRKGHPVKSTFDLPLQILPRGAPLDVAIASSRTRNACVAIHSVAFAREFRAQGF